MAVLFQGFCQNLVILPAVGGRLVEKNIENKGSGSRCRAILDNGGVHLPGPRPLDPLTLGRFQTPLIDDDQRNFRRGGGSLGLQAAKGIVGFQLVRLEKPVGIKKEDQGPGEKSDESPEEYFSFDAGNQSELQDNIPPQDQV